MSNVNKAKREAKKDHDLKNVHNVDLPTDNAPATASASKRQTYYFKNIERRWAMFRIFGGKNSAGKLQNRMTDDAIRVLATNDAKSGPKTKKAGAEKQARNPEKECIDRTHICLGVRDWAHKDDNLYGFPAIALKKAMAQACYTFGLAGNSKIDLIRSTYVHGMYAGLIPMHDFDGKPATFQMQQDVIYARTAQGQKAAIVYRPRFDQWSMDVYIRFVVDKTDEPSLFAMLKAAGEFCGLGSWTNEHNGIYGMWTMDPMIKTMPADFEPAYYPGQPAAIIRPEGYKVHKD